MSSVTLTDRLLVEHVCCLLKTDNNLWFFTHGQSDYITRTLIACKISDDDRCLSHLSKDQVRDIWIKLITDAINLLKWHDDRETTEDDKKQGYSEWLRKTFGHVAYGIDDLDSYFKEFVDFERLLYGAERYYREHLLHVIRVWLIGIFILTKDGYLAAEALNLDIVTTGERGDKKPAFQIQGDERFAIWTLVALCHDLGYPLEKISSINPPLRKMLSAVGKAQVNDFAYSFPRQHQFIDNFITQFISSKLVCLDEKDPNTGGDLFKTEIQSKYYLKFSKSFEDLQHGILSCTLLMKRLVYFLESDFDISPGKKLDSKDAKQFHIRREILRAIAAHTCDDIYHVASNTLRFLLVISDELQQWDRPRLHEMRDDRQDVSIEVFNCNNDSVESNIVIPVPENSNLDDFVNGVEQQARRLFRKFHKVLRTAVDTSPRTFELTWSFCLNNNVDSLTLAYKHARDNTSTLLMNGNEKNDWLYSTNKELLHEWRVYSQKLENNRKD